MWELACLLSHCCCIFNFMIITAAASILLLLLILACYIILAASFLLCNCIRSSDQLRKILKQEKPTTKQLHIDEAQTHTHALLDEAQDSWSIGAHNLCLFCLSVCLSIVTAAPSLSLSQNPTTTPTACCAFSCLLLVCVPIVVSTLCRSMMTTRRRGSIRRREFFPIPCGILMSLSTNQS